MTIFLLLLTFMTNEYPFGGTKTLLDMSYFLLLTTHCLPVNLNRLLVMHLNVLFMMDIYYRMALFLSGIFFATIAFN